MGMNFMNSAESFLECAGLCEVSTYYTFSDVSKGEVSDACMNSMTVYI